jgi:hypothetical protein
MSLDFFCAVESREVGEDLFASAPKNISVWFLLEYPSTWQSDAFEGSDIPAPVKQRLADILNQIPRSRLQLIRQQSRFACDCVTFYIALAREERPVLYHFQLPTYEDLLTLDISAICAEDPAFNDSIETDPLFLVCTHGKRDKCCALYGLPVYNRAVEHAGGIVWQSSHVGGHRFAANLVCFPHGIYYGRLQPDQVPNLLEHYRAGQVDVESYRGRACYPPVAQAAEYFIRRSIGITAVEAFQLDSAMREPDQRWAVQFRHKGGVYRIVLAEEQVMLRKSCDELEPSAVKQYRMVE